MTVFPSAGTVRRLANDTGKTWEPPLPSESM